MPIYQALCHTLRTQRKVAGYFPKALTIHYAMYYLPTFSNVSITFLTVFYLFIYLFLMPSFLKNNLFIYLFLSALGLRCCAQAFSSYGERGLFFIAMCGLLTAVASLVAEHGL